MPDKPDAREIARAAARSIRSLAQDSYSQMWVDAHWVQIVQGIEDAILIGQKSPVK